MSSAYPSFPVLLIASCTVITANITLKPNALVVFYVLLAAYIASWVWHLIFDTRVSLKNHIVLITGAGSGIGRLQAVRFAAQGCSVVLLDIDESAMRETAMLALVASGHAKPNVRMFVCDVRDRRVVFSTLARVRAEVGPVDILVNNAGVVSGKAFLELTEAHIRQTFDVNVLAHFWTIQACLPDMIERQLGHIVTVASIMSMIPAVKLSDYCASKAAVLAMHESLRLELYRAGLSSHVHATVVCPYHINTQMFHGINLPLQWLLPSLTPEYVSDSIIDAVRTRRDIVVLPWLAGLIARLQSLFLSRQMNATLQNALGLLDSMNTFQPMSNVVETTTIPRRRPPLF